jgi:hypothetical protein
LNRESVPLLCALVVPVILIIIVILYYSGIDITEFFRKLNILYYIVMVPIVLGFVAGIIKLLKPD